METVLFFSKTRNPLVGAEIVAVTAKAADLSEEFQNSRIVAFLNPTTTLIIPASRA